MLFMNKTSESNHTLVITLAIKMIHFFLQGTYFISSTLLLTKLFKASPFSIPF